MAEGEALGKEKWRHLQVPLDVTVGEERAILEFCAGLPARRRKEKLRAALLAGFALLNRGVLPAGTAPQPAVAAPAGTPAAKPVAVAVVEVKEPPAKALRGVFQNGDGIGDKK